MRAMSQVAKDLLKEWTIYRMATPAGTGAVLGQPEAWAYVLKARAMSEQQTKFEQDALHRSCSDIVEVMLSRLPLQPMPCFGGVGLIHMYTQSWCTGCSR